MKLLYLLCLYCTVSFAQTTPQQLAERFFKATADNNLGAFKQLYPDVTALTVFIKSVDKKNEYTDAMIEETSYTGTNNAANSFETLQYQISGLGLNLKAAKITNVLTLSEDVQLNESQESDPIMVKATKVTIQFTTAGKGYSLVIPHTLQINGRWYISEEQMEISSL